MSLIFLNLSSLPVALPTIQQELGFSSQMVDWIINVYLLTLTILILPVGRLADLLGFRPIFCWGLALYAIGSLLCGFSPNIVWLLSGRIFQGMGGAAMLPPVGAYLISLFPLGQRGKAIGINVGIGSIFLTLGPLIGGAVAQFLSWRYLFLLNLVIAIFGFILTLRVVQPSPKREKKHFDFFGAILLALSLGSLTIALMEGAKWGWHSSTTLFFFFLSGFSLLLFLGSYKKLAQPIVDLGFFKGRLFTAATSCGCLTQLISMITVFWALYFQNSLGFSPVSAGWMIVITNFPILFLAPYGGHLADSWGVKIPVLMGFSFLIFALVWMTVFATSTSVLLLLPTFLAFGFGVPLIMSPSYAASMDEVHEHQRSAASSLSLALRQLAPTFGMAIMSAFYLSIIEAEKPTLLAFRTVNLLGACIAFLGIMIAILYLPKKAFRLQNTQ